MATLESQKYVIARTVWTENILLVSGRLVENSICCKILKTLKRGPFGDIKNVSKSLTKFKLQAFKNFWSSGRLEPTSFWFSDFKLRGLSLCQAAVEVTSTKQRLINLIKSVSSLVLKKSLL